jgi:hypothetical protein
VGFAKVSRWSVFKRSSSGRRQTLELDSRDQPLRGKLGKTAVESEPLLSKGRTVKAI